MRIKAQVILTLLLLAGMASIAFAQGVIIGLVTDDQTNEGLPCANVQLEGTVLGASTNLQGAFIINDHGGLNGAANAIQWQKSRIPWPQDS